MMAGNALMIGLLEQWLGCWSNGWEEMDIPFCL